MQNLIVKISGWGGGYIDEPISKILSDLQSAETLQMDRWLLKVERNNDCHSTDDRGEDNLPLNVVNNYFSFGVDAQIALQVTNILDTYIFISSKTYLHICYLDLT